MNTNQYIAHASLIHSGSGRKFNTPRPQLVSYNQRKANEEGQKYVDASADKLAAQKYLRNPDAAVKDAQKRQDAAEQGLYSAHRGVAREKAAQRSYAHRNDSHSPTMMDTSKPIAYVMNKNRMTGAQQSYANRSQSHKPELLFGKPNSRIVRKR